MTNRTVFVACLILLWWAGLALARKPKNFRREKAAASSQKSADKELPAGRLTEGRWRPEVRWALEELVVKEGRQGRYDPKRPPVAVFSWDHVSMYNDIAESVFERMIRRVEFRFSEEFWKLVPAAYGRKKIRTAYEQFAAIPPAAWKFQPVYRQYMKFFMQGHQEMCSSLGPKDCRSYLASLLRGYREDEVESYTKQTLQEELSHSLGVEWWKEHPEDSSPVRVRRGLRPVPEIKDLIKVLLEEGFDVWVADLDAQPILSVAAGEYGIDPSRVLGIRQALFGERLTEIIKEPVPIRGGKVEAVIAKVGRPPRLVIGASSGDIDLFDYSNGLRVLIDNGDESLREMAGKKGWLVQPAFVPEK